MRTAVQVENAIVEVLDAEAQPGDAHPADRRELAFGERARLALEGDLFGLVPRRDLRQALDQSLELRRRQERRRAAAEVDEVERTSGDSRKRSVQLPLAREHVEILAHFLRVLVRIHAEVAEVAPLPAERNVQIEAERNRLVRRRLERRLRRRVDRVLGPHRKRGIGGDEITADVGLIGQPCRRVFGHL